MVYDGCWRVVVCDGEPLLEMAGEDGWLLRMMAVSIAGILYSYFVSYSVSYTKMSNCF